MDHFLSFFVSSLHSDHPLVINLELYESRETFAAFLVKSSFWSAILLSVNCFDQDKAFTQQNNEFLEPKSSLFYNVYLQQI